MDPVALAARERWTEPKKTASRQQDLTPFQRKLYANPYAHALSTPVRADRTSAALPTFFYLALHPTPHPTTSESWILPLELSAAADPPRKSKSSTPNDTEPQRQQNNPSNSPTAYVALRRQHLHNIRHDRKKDQWQQVVNTRVQVKMRAAAEAGRIAAADKNDNNNNNNDDDDDDDDDDSGGSGGSARRRRKDQTHMRQHGHRVAQQTMIWREDLDSVVHALLQRVAYRRLDHAFSRPRGGGVLARIPTATATADPSLPARLAALPDADAVVGAVLFLRPLTSAAVRDAQRRVREALENGDALVEQLVKVQEAARRGLGEKAPPRVQGGWEPGGPRMQPGVLYAPLGYAGVRYRVGEEEREVPVYDLVELLGEERLRELVAGTAWEGEAAVVLRGEKNTTIGVHHALMQLQDYVIDTV
ncbi:hypothetical protein SLS58_011122 [Diplodia intermedia]|uniref:Uncharacterized protein n=1 Tax=Diplodia intermedia TaxID=856260 RepID=A0ABR3T1F7_9PEZI